MTPQRVQQLEPAAVGVGAAVLAAFGSVFNEMNAVLFIALVIAFLLDAVTGTLRSFIAAEAGIDWFSWPRFLRGAAKKGVMLTMIFAAALVDAVGAYAFGDLVAQITPFTKYALTHALLAQVLSIWRNGGAVKGLEGLAALLIRKTDVLRVEGEPPARRHYDQPAIEKEHKLREADPLNNEASP